MSLIYTSTSSNVKIYCSYSRTTWEINILFISKSCNPSTNLENIIKRFYTYFLFCLIKTSFFFRIWIIPPLKKRNPVSSATSTYHMMEKEIHWCSDLWGHRHGVRIYCQNFFFIWLGLFHLLLFNSMIRASPPPNSTLEMRILFSNYSTLNSVCKLPDSKNISIKTSSSF